MGARGDGYHLLYLVARRVVSRNHISVRIRRGTRPVSSVPFAAKDTFFQVYNYPEGKICEA